MKRTLLILILLLALCAGCAETPPSAKPSAAPTQTPNPTVDPAVYLDGVFCSRAAQVLPLSGKNVTAAELSAALARLSEVRRVELRGVPFTSRERAALREAYPSVVFQWPVEVLGETFLSTDTTISFAGREDLPDNAADAICAAAGEFYDLRLVDLSGCGLDSDTLCALRESLGGADVRWDFELCGVPVSSTDREIDLSGKKLKGRVEEIEAALPLFSQLEKVVMCECGVSNEDMDALNRKYENIRFVWMVDIAWAAIRTDDIYFTPYAASGVKQTHRRAGLSNLQYCPDLIALDVGHNHARDLPFLEDKPHMKYLIIVENYALDITPIGKMPELKWLEMFQCSTRDLSPLVNCTALEDLNICYITTPGDNVYETLRQMKWLKRLWCSGTRMTRAQLSSLREELPDTEIWCRTGDESTGSTWRYSESYYEMRDAFHMYYMTITGERTKRLDEEGLAKMHKRFWKE